MKQEIENGEEIKNINESNISSQVVEWISDEALNRDQDIVSYGRGYDKFVRAYTRNHTQGSYIRGGNPGKK